MSQPIDPILKRHISSKAIVRIDMDDDKSCYGYFDEGTADGNYYFFTEIDLHTYITTGVKKIISEMKSIPAERIKKVALIVRVEG